MAAARLSLATIASLLAPAHTCSYAPPSGVAITNAEMQGESLRLELTDMGDEEDFKSGGSVQALLDFDTGTLTRLEEQNLEFMPTVLPFWQSEHTSTSWLPMNDTVVVARWYSAALSREYVLYAADAYSDLQLAICQVPGTCELSLAVPSGIGMLEPGRAPLVWDDIGVVSLYLQCCMCTTNVYVKFTATTLTVLYSRDEGYNLGAVAWDPATDAVFVASSSATGLGDDARPLEVTRHDYATLTTTTVSLSPAQLEGLMSSCGAACIAGIVSGATAVLLLCGLACFVARRRRQKALDAALQSAGAAVNSQPVEAKMVNAA